MLRLIGVVVSIGLADSINPTTILPAMYLATRERPAAQVIEFTLAVFLVYLVGGALIALGPGQLLLSIVPKPDAEDRYVLETIAGVAMLCAALFLWIRRDKLARRTPPVQRATSRSGAVLGATITAVELPTAFPYFAAIAAIVGSGFDPLQQLLALVLFNVCFVLPLVGIAVTLAIAGDRARETLEKARYFLYRRWPVILAALALLAGIFVTLLGASGLGGRGHGRFGHFLRGVRHVLHP